MFKYSVMKLTGNVDYFHVLLLIDKVQIISACFLAIILIQMPIWLLFMDNADNIY